MLFRSEIKNQFFSINSPQGYNLNFLSKIDSIPLSSGQPSYSISLTSHDRKEFFIEFFIENNEAYLSMSPYTFELFLPNLSEYIPSKFINYSYQNSNDQKITQKSLIQIARKKDKFLKVKNSIWWNFWKSPKDSYYLNPNDITFLFKIKPKNN